MAQQVVVSYKVSGSAPLRTPFIEISGYSRARVQTYGAVSRSVDVYVVPATLKDTNPGGTPTPDISSARLVGFQGASGSGWKTLIANVDILAPYLYVELSNFAGSEEFAVVITLQE